MGSKVRILKKREKLRRLPGHALWQWDVLEFLKQRAARPMIDLVLTSPPYNLGKEYEGRLSTDEYIAWQCEVLDAILPRLKPTASICWQVGNFVENGSIEPLDIMLHPEFKARGLVLRNRIIWHYGHGLHCKKRFSGRYEVVLWYTRSDDYTFNLDDVRVPSKYPGKRAWSGPRVGELTCNPLGKNPEDVWNIRNVGGNNKEKTIHPCQFPVGLAERIILALSNAGDLVFDPFCGVGSSGVAAASHGRRYWGCDIEKRYIQVARKRIQEGLDGTARYRPHDQVVFDHRKSGLSRTPPEFSRS